MFVILYVLSSVVAATDPSQCTRNVVYHVTNLHQVNMAYFNNWIFKKKIKFILI